MAVWVQNTMLDSAEFAVEPCGPVRFAAPIPKREGPSHHRARRLYTDVAMTHCYANQAWADRHIYDELGALRYLAVP